MSKIELKDTIIEIITKMADGNIGAITALTELFNNNAKIDPQSALSDLSTILYLDDNEIYGTDIYICFVV